MIHCLSLLFIYLILVASSQAKTVATIGNKSIVIDKLTSCDLKNWNNDQALACGCCITKGKVTTSNTADNIVRLCINNKHCTLKTLAQWAPGETNPEEIISQVTWNTIDNPAIDVDPKNLDKNGNIKPENLIDFLSNLRKDLRDLKEPLYTDFSKPKCLSTKSLNSGGANTAQLFMINVDENCVRGMPPKAPASPKYIIKETKMKSLEIRNLRALHSSELITRYNLSSLKRPKDRLAIAFDLLNIKYSFKNKNHYLTFMPIAPGRSMMSIVNELGTAIKTGNLAQEHKYSVIVYNAFYKLGADLGEFHKYFMDPSQDQKKILRDTVVDGDLHLNNIFILVPEDYENTDGYEIYIIDPETLALSLPLNKKRPVGVDFVVLYTFSVSQFKTKQYVIPKEISLTKWNNIMLKPLSLSYIKNWPPAQRQQIIAELRNQLTNPFAILKLLPQRFLFINPISYRAKIKDINRVFDEISMNP